MKRRRPYAEPRKPYINLGPMVDISLALLIIFILAIPFFIESGLFVSKAAVAKGRKPKTITPQKSDIKVNIYLKSDGTILLNGEPRTMEELDSLIPQLLARSVSRNAILSADDEVIYDQVIHMIDFLKIKGAEDVLIVKRKTAG